MIEATLEGKPTVRYYGDDHPDERWSVDYAAKGKGFRCGGSGAYPTHAEAIKGAERVHIIYANPAQAAAILDRAHATHTDLASTYDLTDDLLAELDHKAARA